ncbi:lysylphosphatidylglycerol synthase transmembrane domain-containing protein [Dysgonomonas sp. 25]|uniref:lysylphosphatidylglycerol synthase transmembrane domain-containing protein n=1 Tax=Dysgonomonas sp. 25 TaxID=2302933 RepID=UPI0013D5A427|nr:lysylphosphatidylglycerol synthase transmembrane domain-containing protein [Dysgonomonas sp. 25]NDV68390.1 UPF0104 family protein [Dysgonomonas sp. 25]
MNTVSQEQSSKKSSLLNKLLKIVLPLFLGVFVLYLLFRKTDFHELWSILKDANWAILAFSLLFGLLGNTIRGYRWSLLIEPLGYKPKVSNLIFSIYGSYAVNFAIPRGGEIWRCAMVSKEEKVPFVRLVGTVVLDRVLDTIMVLLITLFAFFINMQFFIHYAEANEQTFAPLLNLLSSPFLYAAIVGAVLATFVVFRFFKDNFIVKKVRGIIDGFWKDLKAIWRMKQKLRLIAYSFMIWGCYFLYFYITFYAFDFTDNLGITAGLIAFALSSITMAIPTNGGMGVWHAAVIASLVLYSVPETQAEAFAFGVFAMQSLWLIVCGLFGIAAFAIKNRHTK